MTEPAVVTREVSKSIGSWVPVRANFEPLILVNNITSISY
jgi:hypothetical protein